MPEFIMEPESTGYAKIKVIGVGGGGCNAVDWMFDTGLQNVEFFCLNTDAQALKRYKCPNKIQIGSTDTKGRGCGGNAEVGARCMEEEHATVEELLQGADIVFITAGLGGGTGTGGAPIVASIARSLGILTVGVVTRPFRFEGPRRMQTAENGLEKLRKDCDTIITVSNDRLLEVAGSKSTLREAFGVANNVLSQAVQSISDLVTIPGLINVDFNDIRTVMGDRGGAVMGIGVGKGENRAGEAVKKATSSPLLEKLVMDGATGVLVSITGGPDLTLGHVNEAMSMVYETVDTNAEIIFGAVVDESIHDEMRVIIIATGFPEEMHRMAAEERQAEMVASAPAAPFAEPMNRPTRPAAIVEQARTVAAQAPSAPRHIPAPEYVAPVAHAAAPARAAAVGNLRSSLDELRQEEPHAAAMPSVAPQRAAALSGAAPSVRTVPAAPIVRPAPAVRPAGGNGEGQIGAPRAEYNAVKDSQEKPSIPIYNPAAPQSETEVPAAVAKNEDYEIPAFLRRRRSALFD